MLKGCTKVNFSPNTAVTEAEPWWLQSNVKSGSQAMTRTSGIKGGRGVKTARVNTHAANVLANVHVLKTDQPTTQHTTPYYGQYYSIVNHLKLIQILKTRRLLARVCVVYM